MTSRILMAAALIFAAIRSDAQVIPAAGSAPPDDKPSIRIGATIFADYTYNESPETKDVNANEVNTSSFNVARAYLNLTGNLNHLISFRITPDIVRETGSGSSLNGSQTFRLKYAFAQLNLEDWLTKGSFARFGMQQTPYLDYTDGIYRYRFQGSTILDRDGLLSSADNGVSARYVFPGNYGDLHGGFYNGEGYNRAEANDRKAFMIRASLRPFPLGGGLSGLRLTAFHDADAYASASPRERTVGQVTFENPRITVGVEGLDSKDRPTLAASEANGRGWSAWATPKLGSGWELLLRHDEREPDSSAGLKRERNIAGIAYWLPNLQKVTATVMLDYDALSVTGVPDDTRYGVKVLVSF